MVALSKVKSWLLWIVIAQAKAKGSWDQVKDFLALSSHHAATFMIGIQEGSILSHPGVGGPVFLC